MQPLLIDVRRLAEVYNPYEIDLWSLDNRVTKKEVEQAIQHNQYNLEVWTGPGPFWSHTGHVERIAFLVVNGWDQPIEIAAHSKFQIDVPDGNHRLAAAIYLNLPAILAVTYDYPTDWLSPYLWKSNEPAS